MLLTWWQSRPSFQFCHFATWHEEETNMWCDAWWSSWPKTCFVQRPFRLCFYHHHCRQLAWKTNRSGHSLTYQEKWGNIENEAQLTMPIYLTICGVKIHCVFKMGWVLVKKSAVAFGAKIQMLNCLYTMWNMSSECIFTKDHLVRDSFYRW